MTVSKYKCFCLRAVLCLTLFSVPSARADVVTTLSFDDLSSSLFIDPTTDSLALNGYVLTDQYASLGVMFNNVLIADAVNQLDSSQTPPRSGDNVAISLGDPIQITFLTPVSSFLGYFNHFDSVTLSAYDSFSNLIGSAGHTGDNTGDASTQNEPLSLGNLPISSVTLTSPSSFTLDDLTFVQPTGGTTLPPTPTVPEPGTALFFVLGLPAVFAIRAKFTHSQQAAK